METLTVPKHKPSIYIPVDKYEHIYAIIHGSHQQQPQQEPQEKEQLPTNNPPDNQMDMKDELTMWLHND